MTFDDLIATIQQRVSYLRCAVLDETHDGSGGLNADGWFRVSDLCADADRVESLIHTTGQARGAEDAQVAASLFVQSVAFRLASVAAAGWALGAPSTTLDPAQVAFRITRNRPGELGVWSTEVVSHDASSLAAALIDGLVSPMIAVVRRRIQVGERMLFGNAASSIASVFRAVQSTGPLGDAEVRSRALELFAAHPRLHELGTWATIETDVSLGWFWDRGNCCLWYRSTEAEGRYCDDCSLRDPAERTERRRLELIASTT
jgi:ferric iron reductase protein FhuF